MLRGFYTDIRDREAIESQSLCEECVGTRKTESNRAEDGKTGANPDENTPVGTA